MSPLQSELNRLYFVHPPNCHNGHAQASGLIAADGRVRAMVLELARPTDWNSLATVWRGVQADLGLPAPAIAVSGIDGHQLWFSLAEPVGAADARSFLEALCMRYLGAVDPWRIGVLPGFDAHAPTQAQHARLVPALQAENGRWSAFVSSDLAAIFTDEPWLDLEPAPEAQARLLSRLECIQPAAFKSIMNLLKPAAGHAVLPVVPVPGEHPIDDKDRAQHESPQAAAPAAPTQCLEPKRFLMDVMNDPTVALHLRMEAAKALLPYF